jgi:signal transduction histidine kinase
MFATDRAIVLRVTEAGTFTVAFSTGYSGEEMKSIRMSQRDRLARWLSTNETALIVETNKDILNYLTDMERDMLARLDVRVVLPLVALNKLTGVMLLSSSQRRWRLTQDDLSLLQMLMNQASLGFENAYLYQQQRERQRRLLRAQRLAAAGQLAASVAHEIRNPLTSIRSTVQYLLSDMEADNPRRDLVEGVLDEVDRIAGTVDGLLSLTRGIEFRPERIALGRLIKQTLLLISAQGNNQSVEIVLRAPQPELHVMGDEAQLKQLFLNLMLNAIQAMSNGGQLEIVLSVKSESLGLSTEKTWANALFKDTGCGIPAQNLDKIFDPFFTTKKGGTGLGLYTSYAIAQQHGGELEIESREGEGTEVSVRLPIVK